MKLQLVLVLVPALVAALLGWRTTRFRRHSLYDETPGDMSKETYDRVERRRHAIRRISSVLLYGLAGAAVGFGLSLYFRLHA